jgi:hypothetical protein
MGILGAIVLSQALLMVTIQPEVPQGGAVRTQLVGGHPLWGEALFPQQLAHELDGGAAVSPALKQIVEVDLPGLTSPMLHRFDWTRLPRPVIPLDDGVQFSLT